MAETYSERVKRTGDQFEKVAGTGARGVARTSLAAIEDAANILSGVGGDLAGALAAVATQNAARGRAVKQALTYQPRSETARASQPYLQALTSPVTSVIDAPASALEKSGHPIAAQTVRAALDVAPLKIPRGLRAVAPEVSASRAAGYVMEPTKAYPSVLNKVMEVAADPKKLQQSASLKNQRVTHDLVRTALGIKDGAPITRSTLAAVRKKALDAHSRGEVTADHAAEMIAKADAVERALDKGSVSAVKLGQELSRQKRLPGAELNTAGQFGRHFPRAAQTTEQVQAARQLTPGKVIRAVITAKHPGHLATKAAQAAARAAVLSRTGQRVALQGLPRTRKAALTLAGTEALRDDNGQP